MSRSLRWLGIVLLCVAVWALLAGSARWLEQGRADHLAKLTGLVGVACVGIGILLGFMGRMGRPLRRGRCVRCGAPTERGQVYCLDHLRQTVDQTRDQIRQHAGAGKLSNR
jgi:hypothetical protein